MQIIKLYLTKRSNYLISISAVTIHILSLSSVRARAAEPSVLINEFMAWNRSVLANTQGEYEDWIELYNAGTTAVDIGGLYLTDDLDNPTKWRIPQNRPDETTVGPGERLLIWADNPAFDVAAGADAGLHAGFKLSKQGEEIGLFEADGQTRIDFIRFGPQRANVSYGRYPDGDPQGAYLTAPTPLQPNQASYAGVLSAPEVSHSRGFYDEPVTVTLTTGDKDAFIIYTLDGSNPLDEENNLPVGEVYQGPLIIQETTCLRVATRRDGWLSSPVVSHTYLFLDDIVNQSPQGQTPGPDWPSGSVAGQRFDYGMDPEIVNDPAYADQIDDALLSLPTLSFTTDLKNLFDPQSGIYIHCGGYTRNERGPDWERPVSIELIHPDGSEGFQVNAGLRMRGITSCGGNNPKHAFRLFFNSLYGEDDLHYPLFDEEGVDVLDNVDLRCAANYSWNLDSGSYGARNTYVREVFCRDLQGALGQPYTRSRYYHLYINGQYWGVYQTQERAEASYAANYFGGDPDDYDVIKTNQEWYRSIEVTDGNLDAYRRLWDAALAGFATDEAYYRVQGLNPDGSVNSEFETLLDVDNLIDYMLTIFYTGDFDAPISQWENNRACNNFYAVFNRVNPDGFKFFRHDGEHTMMSLFEDRTGPFTHPDLNQFEQFNPQTLHQKLTAHPQYSMRFADRAQRALFHSGPMTADGADALMTNRIQSIQSAMIAESARWGDAQVNPGYPPRTRDGDWAKEIDFLLSDYLPRRTDIVLDQLQARQWYPIVGAPEFLVGSQVQYGGPVADSDLISMQSDAGDIYYTLDGSDPKPSATPGDVPGETILIPENGFKTVWIPDHDIGSAWTGGNEPFDDSGWTPLSPAAQGTGAIGYERDRGYQGTISHDIESSMYDHNASCYVRYPFTVDVNVLGTFAGLTLKVRCDDGFVAYLNGTEVASLNKPANLTWNSDSSNRPDSIDFIDFDLTDGLDQLQSGNNIIAIHALNQNNTSSDFLISIELRATVLTEQDISLTPSAQRYVTPLTLSHSVAIKARTYDRAQWSALSDTVFIVGTEPLRLRITEIMYHPLDTGDPDDPQAEFIELKNFANNTVNLYGTRFTEGIRFTFPSMDLPPGQAVLVVADTEVFAQTYGESLPVVGQYEGRLSNGGERIVLLDLTGRTIHDFSYDDAWFSSTDGQGFSLEVIDPDLQDPATWDRASTWTPSALPGGSPGR